MAAVADPDDDTPKKASKMPLIIGLVLAVLGGVGGFFAVKTGMLGGDGVEEVAPIEQADEAGSTAPQVAFVPIDPLVVSLPRAGSRALLRFAAQIEVAPENAAAVEALKPRIVDVLNGYLRAVDMDELEDPNALMRLRAQMLRRIQIVTGPDMVRDLLIMEFVLN